MDRGFRPDLGKPLSVWIGFDPREAAAFAVARESIKAHTKAPLSIHGIVLSDLRARGLYTREMETRPGEHGHDILWDPISGAPCSTEFAISRFLTPHLAKTGIALFMDCDVMVRTDLMSLFRQMEYHDYAVMCVKHAHSPVSSVKMDGQVQTVYSRKNWSSVLLFQCDHPSNKKLTLEMINTLPGRDLHRLCWLEDHEIGELDQAWNFLVGHTDPEIVANIAHFTDGIPTMRGYENVQYANEWRAVLERWAA